MKRFSIIIAAVALFATGCAQNDAVDNITTPTRIGDFTATLEASTRTSLDADNNVLWTTDDKVSIFACTQTALLYRVAQGGATSATLRQVGTDEPSGELLDCNIAYYPAAQCTSYAAAEGTHTLAVTLPTNQIYAAASFGAGANPMAAVSADKNLAFKNVCGALMIQLKGTQKITSMTLTGNNNEKISGAATVTVSAEGVPTIAMTDATATTLTLDCGEGVTLNPETPTEFWFVLPPMTFTGGLKVDISDADGCTMTKTTSNTVTITRAMVQPLTAFEYGGVIPQNQIWYTTTDGTKLTPTTTNAFGAAYTDENNVYSDGKGIITFGSDVTRVGGEAFKGCTTLASITLPNGITMIGDSAFEGCSALQNITIPTSVTEVRSTPFLYCSSLRNFYGKFASADNRCLIKDNVLIAFAPMGVTSYTIPDGVTSIGTSVFRSCTALESVTIPATVGSIGESAFFGCSALVEVNSLNTTPPTLVNINAFENNADTRYIYVPVENVGAYKTAWTTYADYIKAAKASTIEFVDPNVKAICVANFDTDHDGEISYTEAEAVTSLGTGFKGNTTITSFDELKHFTGLTNIEVSAFEGCTNLESITTPWSVKNLETSCFSGCTKLTNVTLHADIEGISSYAFKNCKSLTNFNCPGNVLRIWSDTFEGCDKLATFNGGNMKMVNSPCLYYRDWWNNFHVVYFSKCNTDVSYTVPEGITRIDYGAFRGCTRLETITLPAGLKEIESSAFESCTALETINLPAGLTSLGYSAFMGCHSLKSIAIPSDITKIGSFTFWDCYALESVTLPKTLTVIEKSAFANCTSLASVYCQATTPPTVSSDSFSNNAADRKFYVHNKLVYGSYANWKTYITDAQTAAPFLPDPNHIINFEDAAVKAICVTNFDGIFDGVKDGELSSAEADAVTSLRNPDNDYIGYFQGNTTIQNLRPLLYFTSLTMISANAFDGCTSLRFVVVPAGVTSVGAYAFKNCSGLTNGWIMSMNTTPPTLGTEVFSGFTPYREIAVGSGGGCKLHVPSGSESAYAGVWTYFPLDSIFQTTLTD